MRSSVVACVASAVFGALGMLAYMVGLPGPEPLAAQDSRYPSTNAPQGDFTISPAQGFAEPTARPLDA